MTWLMDPRVFNVLIMCLYGINAGWWAWHGKFGDMFYWMGALWITAAVTWGYQR